MIYSPKTDEELEEEAINNTAARCAGVAVGLVILGLMAWAAACFIGQSFDQDNGDYQAHKSATK